MTYPVSPEFSDLRFRQKRQLLIAKYWRWIWFHRFDDTMQIMCKTTGRVLEVGLTE